ncbi:MFS transporter [Aspergillus homomorphus CBS 101889]|uniref:MFS multidrug transporter n=1 Tax=Aspergillus homomorphus (strain CBS 101889) TaxID=1450537 RepID=A0A395HUF0_ASPHC|nr:MFS multidrug transporter [Aspergillus homomorphus CBS 101889]RAL11562.1 MFS multidrug transporter [Aspergillus homomorphus CBS 101889]
MNDKDNQVTQEDEKQDSHLQSSQSSSSSIIIDFERDEHPHDWPSYRKWIVLLTLIPPVFLMPLSSTIIAPAVDTISTEFQVGSTVTGPLAVSLFLVTYSIGPLLLGPLSELVGRVPVLQGGNLFFLVFNLAGGFAKSFPQLLVFRLLSGFGASATLAVGSSTIGDCFRPEERGLGLALLNMGPVLGSCLGPIAGAYLTDYTSWRWAFHATSIFGGVAILVGICLARETYAPVLLRSKKDKLQSQPYYKDATLRTRFDMDDANKPDNESLAHLYKRTLLRSIRLLLTQPIVQVLALYYGYLYGLVYLVLSTFSTLWTTQYHMSTSRGSLNYLAPCIGYLLGAQTCAIIADKVYKYLKRNPEFRLPLMIPASLLIPIGLLIYGWTAEAQTHWIFPDLGIALPLMGATIIFQCTNAYLLETYSVYAASANGGVYILRGLTGFGFPLFSPPMYRALGYGWGNSVLGLTALVIGCPIPWFLWRYGEGLRRRSSWAEQ